MCEICRHNPCLSQCPNYAPPKADYYCPICKEGIYGGDAYVENIYGEYIHRDCLNCNDSTLEYLKIKTHIMEEIYEKYY
jgi:hypothetical protein